MGIKKFSEMRWWSRILVLLLADLFLATIIWLGICSLMFLITYDIEKTAKGFESVVFGKNSGIYFGVSLLATTGLLIWLYVKHSPKLGGRLNKDKEFEEADYGARWLSQEELQKKLVVLKDDVESTYATWTIAGVQNAVHQNGSRIKEEVSYHILACDKRCLQLQLKEKGRPIEINGGKNIMDLTAGCTIVIGAGRSGKTKQVVKPSILHLLNNKEKSSMLICDLKGDIYKETSKIAEAKGFNVLRFNTTNSKCSHSWNPLTEIWDLYYNDYLPNWRLVKKYRVWKEKTEISQTSNQQTLPSEILRSINKAQADYLTAKGLIEKKLDTIVNIISPINKNSKEQFFDKKAQDLIKLYYLLPLDFGINKQEYTLHNLSVTGLELENKLTLLQDMLPEWALSKTLSKQFKNIGGQDSLMDVQHTANKNLNNFALQEIKDLTSLTDKNIDFEEFIKKPTVIYLSIDTTSNEGTAANSLAVLFMEMLYSHLQDHLNKNQMTHFPKPILFVIDEFGNLPKMEFILTIFSGNQGQNIMAMLVLQSATGQINETYNNNQRTTLFDNTQCFILTSGVNPEFAKWLSVKSGSNNRKTLSKSINDDGKISKSQSTQRMSEIPEEEFANIKTGEELIIFPNGSKPCKITYKSADKLKWYHDITLNYEVGKDIPYSTMNFDEFDFFENGLNETIIKLWIYKNNVQGGVEFKRNLAVELLNTPRFSSFRNKQMFEQNEINFFDEQYKTLGGYPCTALQLTNDKIKDIGFDFSDKPNNSSDKNKQNSPSKKISNTNKSKTVGDNLVSDNSKLKKDESLKIGGITNWGEKNFVKQVSIAKTIFKNVDLKHPETMTDNQLLAFLLLLGVYDWNNIEQKYFSSQKEIDHFLNVVYSDERFQPWLDLNEKDPPFSDTYEELMEKFKPILEKKLDLSTLPYVFKLIDFLLLAWQNSEEGLKHNGKPDILWKILEDKFNIKNLEKYQGVIARFKTWKLEHGNKLE